MTIQILDKAIGPLKWSSPNGEIISRLDIKIEVWPSHLWVDKPRGSELHYYRNGGYMRLYEGSTPQWVLPERYLLRYYANRFYTPAGAEPTGFEIRCVDGIGYSVWAEYATP